MEPQFVTPPAVARGWLSPKDCLLGLLAYMGGLGAVAIAGGWALVWPRKGTTRAWPRCGRQLDRLCLIGLPLITLMQVSLGAFLAMQAFFNATFRDATGAVVGLGLLRNMSTITSGWLLAGLTAVLYVPELRRRPPGLDDDPHSVPDRDVTQGLRPDERPRPDPAGLTGARVLAAVVAGPILAVWGSAVGIAIGMLVAQSLLSVTPGLFLGKLFEMLQPFDAVGLLVRGALFGGLSALVACHEGTRLADQPATAEGPAVFRAVVISLLVIMVLNACWFTLAHLSGSPFGPGITS